MGNVENGGSLEQRVAANVRRLRRERGLTQLEFGRRLGEYGFPMQQTTVTKLEAGDRPIRLDEVHAIAQLLEVDFSALIETPIQARDDVTEEQLEAALEHVRERLAILRNEEIRLRVKEQEHLRQANDARSALAEMRPTLSGVAEAEQALVKRLEFLRGEHREEA